jgi:YgiT-type zinc finger domain-containing protein
MSSAIRKCPDCGQRIRVVYSSSGSIGEWRYAEEEVTRLTAESERYKRVVDAARHHDHIVLAGDDGVCAICDALAAVDTFACFACEGGTARPSRGPLEVAFREESRVLPDADMMKCDKCGETYLGPGQADSNQRRMTWMNNAAELLKEVTRLTAENEKLKDELSDVSWETLREKAEHALECGRCPVCGGDDETGHKEGCQMAALEEMNARLTAENAKLRHDYAELLNHSYCYILCVYYRRLF